MNTKNIEGTVFDIIATNVSAVELLSADKIENLNNSSIIVSYPEGNTNNANILVSDENSNIYKTNTLQINGIKILEPVDTVIKFDDLFNVVGGKLTNTCKLIVNNTLYIDFANSKYLKLHPDLLIRIIKNNKNIYVEFINSNDPSGETIYVDENSDININDTCNLKILYNYDKPITDKNHVYILPL